MSTNRCFICGEDNPNVLQEHHSVPNQLGGSDDPENLYRLCANCHQAVERIYDKDFYRRLAVAVGIEPSTFTDLMDGGMSGAESAEKPTREIGRRGLVEWFSQECLEYDSGCSVIRESVYQVFNEWLQRNDEIDVSMWDFSEQATLSSFGKCLNEHFEKQRNGRVYRSIGHTTKNQESAWKNLTFSENGERIREHCSELEVKSVDRL